MSNLFLHSPCQKNIRQGGSAVNSRSGAEGVAKRSVLLTAEYCRYHLTRGNGEESIRVVGSITTAFYVRLRRQPLGVDFNLEGRVDTELKSDYVDND